MSPGANVSDASTRRSGGGSSPYPGSEPSLTARQETVLRALVAAYVGSASPVGSGTISLLVPIKLSAASIRSTMAELEELDLIHKPHASAGRIPTEGGLRIFVDQLLALDQVAAYEQRSLTQSLDALEGEADAVMHRASLLLSEHTRQLGFVVPPRVERAVLRHVSLVRLSSERLLVVLVSQSGRAYRRVVEDPGRFDQHELDHMAAELNERIAGRTLAEVRTALRSEIDALRSRADRLLEAALLLGLRALPNVRPGEGPDRSPGSGAALGAAGREELSDLLRPDFVIATRLALLSQPEFNDPERIRELMAAIETQEHLVALIDRVLEADGVSVAMGEQLEDPGLRQCALVAAPYGVETAPVGVLGVIGPSRMDYARIIPLVEFCSHLLTEKLNIAGGMGDLDA